MGISQKTQLLFGWELSYFKDWILKEGYRENEYIDDQFDDLQRHRWRGYTFAANFSSTEPIKLFFGFTYKIFDKNEDGQISITESRLHDEYVKLREFPQKPDELLTDEFRKFIGRNFPKLYFFNSIW